MKAKATDLFYKTVAKFLAILGIEVHYKNPRYSWMMIPLDSRFIDTYKKYKVKEMSYVSLNGLHVLYQFLSYAINLPGDVAQLGVYKGGSAAILASLVEGIGKKFYLFDTFEGLPPTVAQDNINGYIESKVRPFADAPLEQVEKYLSDFLV